MLSQQLATSISHLEFETLPEKVVCAAKRCLLDTLGVTLAGSRAEEVRLALKAAQHWGSMGPCLVWGTDISLSAPHAALTNGTAAHARELDDYGCGGHTGAVVIPPALAAAELLATSGKDLITSIVAGYEVSVRVLDALGGYNAHTSLGWHSTGTVSTFGAAASAGRVLRLDAQQLAWSLGLAGTFTGGIWAFIVDGAMSKRLHAGKAAETGLVAALLAKEGFTGPLAIFDENAWGSFIGTYGADFADPQALVEDLDSGWSGILRAGFKPYACCSGIHSSLDVAFQLKRELSIGARDVNQIVVRGSEKTVLMLGKREIDTVLDAQMSLPYSLALAFVVGRASPDEYEPPYLHDPELASFAQRVKVVEDPDIPPSAQPVVEVHLRDSRVVERSVEHAKGTSENPMSDQELEEKFMSLAQRVLPLEHAKSIPEMVWQLEELPRVSELIASLRHSPED